MNAAEAFLIGIVSIHVLWLTFFLVGSVLWAPRLTGASDELGERSDALMHVVLATATGMALIGFATFVLGLLGLLYPVTFIALIVAALGASALAGDSPLRRDFWQLRLAVLRAAATPAAAALYAVTLIVAIPAVLPESGFDALFFHLVYALDWSEAHRIYVDQWVRFPYYAQNWIVLDAWMYVLGLGNFEDFLGWLAGALAVLGTFGLVCSAGSRLCRQSPRRIEIAGACAGIAVFLTPAFQRWLDTGMVDVELGFFFIVSVAATLLACITRRKIWLWYVVLCFPFFTGMKGSFIAFIPVTVLAAWIAASSVGLSFRKALIVCIAALALSLPWYAKNVIQAGDPVAPYMNLALHRHDSKWTAADMQGVMSDIVVDTSPRFLLKMPVDMLVHPDSFQYREPGFTFLMATYWLPGIVAFLCLLRGREGLRDPWLVFSGLVFFAIAYWLVTTHLGRYALLFLPALAAFTATAVLRAIDLFPRARNAAFALLALAALPLPAGAAFLSSVAQVDYAHLGMALPETQRYLALTVQGYAEEEVISKQLVKDRIPDARAYVVGDGTLAYYFKLHGVSQVGDWFGPERYSDLVAAIAAGTAPQFFHGLGVSAVLVLPHPLFPRDRDTQLSAELIAAGYREEYLPAGTGAMYFGPGVVAP